MICLWRADLRDTDKSWYFVITEFNNCLIIRSASLFFLMNILRKQSDLIFLRKSDHKKEKGTVSFTHVLNIICSQRQLDGIVHEQTIICRRWALGGLSANEKKEKFASNDNESYYSGARFLSTEN